MKLRPSQATCGSAGDADATNCTVGRGAASAGGEWGCAGRVGRAVRLATRGAAAGGTGVGVDCELSAAGAAAEVVPPTGADEAAAARAGAGGNSAADGDGLACTAASAAATVVGAAAACGVGVGAGVSADGVDEASDVTVSMTAGRDANPPEAYTYQPPPSASSAASAALVAAQRVRDGAATGTVPARDEVGRRVGDAAKDWRASALRCVDAADAGDAGDAADAGDAVGATDAELPIGAPLARAAASRRPQFRQKLAPSRLSVLHTTHSTAMMDFRDRL